MKQDILVITHIDFWKIEMGSHQRLLSMLEYLSNFFNIDIVYIGNQKNDDLQAIQQLNLKVIFLNEIKIFEYDEKVLEIFMAKHPVLKPFIDRKLYAKMAFISQGKIYSNVIIEYIHLSYFIPLFKKSNLILDSIDIMNLRSKVFEANNKKHWIDITEEEEIDIYNSFNVVLAIQKTEYNYMIEKNINALLIPHPVEAKNNFINKTSNKNIIFIGGYNDGNIDSIKWFIDNVWDVFSKVKGLKLCIYGTVSSAFKNHKERLTKKNIILYGKVQNIDEVYKSAQIAINPVFIGGGIKIKNIEAMANSIPLITTNQGAKGIEEAIDKAFLLANTKDEWIDKIISLLISDKLNALLSTNAYNFIKNNFDKDSCYRDLITYLSKKKI